MPLTAVHLNAARPREKSYRLTDGAGMYLEVTPAGGRYWRLKYRFGGKEKRLALGVYPTVTLAEARKRRDRARELLSNGTDPGVAKQAVKRTQRLNAENSFEAIAREWWAKFSPTLSESHAKRNLRRLESHVFPTIGSMPVAEVDAPALLGVLRKLEARDTLETGHRVRSLVGQVLRYAIATGRATRDASADLRGALPQPQVRHHAAVLDPVALGGLLRAIDGYSGTAVVSAALKLAPLVFQRPGELRQADWGEFDLDAATWVIPSTRMKRTRAGKENGPDHIVPLSTQAVEILRQLHKLTGTGRFVFPSARGRDRCMSDMALQSAFRRMGIDSDTALPHGWRATARTLAVEALGVPAEVVEMQLSHEVRDSLGRAYNRVQWLAERRALMQRWADWLDELKRGAKVLPINGTNAI
jgi:integrase